MDNIFHKIFLALHKYDVQYILIGGLALILHGIPRSTFDSDIVILERKENISNLLKAVEFLKFVPMQADMTTPDAFSRLEKNECATFSSKKGDAYLDIFLEDQNVFSDYAKQSETRKIYGVEVRIASLQLLKSLKLISNREIDQIDISLIEKRLSLDL